LSVPIIALPFFWHLFRKIKMPAGEYVVALWPAISGCILMAIAVELFKRSPAPGWPLYIDLFFENLNGAIVYVLALVLMRRERLSTFLRLIKSVRSRTNDISAEPADQR
jgi:hypothetical protein